MCLRKVPESSSGLVLDEIGSAGTSGATKRKYLVNFATE